MGQYEAGYAIAPSPVASYGASRGGAPVVSFENVSKHYGNLHAVDGLTLDLRHGETVALLGPNGAGKCPRWTCCSRCASPPADESRCSALTRTTR